MGDTLPSLQQQPFVVLYMDILLGFLANFLCPRALFICVDALLNTLFLLSFQSFSLSSFLRRPLSCKRRLRCFNLCRSIADLIVCSYFHVLNKGSSFGYSLVRNGKTGFLHVAA